MKNCILSLLILSGSLFAMETENRKRGRPEDLETYITQLQVRDGIRESLNARVKGENCNTSLQRLCLMSCGEVKALGDEAFEDFIDRCARVAVEWLSGELTRKEQYINAAAPGSRFFIHEEFGTLFNVQRLVPEGLKRAAQRGDARSVAKLLLALKAGQVPDHPSSMVWNHARHDITKGLKKSNPDARPRIMALLENRDAVHHNDTE